MLNDIRVKNAKLETPGKARKIPDRGDGLYLYLSTLGAKSWRFDFRHGKSTKLAADGTALPRRWTITYGRYPAMGLSAARLEHDKAKVALAKGENPALLKQRRKLQSLTADDFQTIAERWYLERVKPHSTSWQKNCRLWLKLVYPYIGKVSIKTLGPAEVLAMLRAIEKKKNAYVAEEVRKTVTMVFDFAIQNLLAETNHARSFKGVIEVPEVKTHPHIPVKELPSFLKAVDASQSNPRTKIAARLLMLLFCRKNELLQSRWTELDITAGKLEIPGERMKMRKPHLIPLAKQAIECFQKLEGLSEGSEFIFPKEGDLRKPMAGQTLNLLFATIGYAGRLTPHGLRSTASTTLHEAGFRHDVVELQLSHARRNAYNKAEHLVERRELMKYWADLIDSLAAGGNVITFKRGQAAA